MISRTNSALACKLHSSMSRVHKGSAPLQRDIASLHIDSARAHTNIADVHTRMRPCAKASRRGERTHASRRGTFGGAQSENEGSRPDFREVHKNMRGVHAPESYTLHTARV